MNTRRPERPRVGEQTSDSSVGSRRSLGQGQRRQAPTGASMASSSSQSHRRTGGGDETSQFSGGDDTSRSTSIGNQTNAYLLDRMGGEPALEAVVDEFYTRLIADEKLTRFFDGVNVRKLKRHQRGFLKVAFTKVPDSIDVPTLLLKKHERLFRDMALDETHFDVVAAHLIETMQSLGLKQHLVDEAVGIVAPLRAVFVEGAAKSSDMTNGTKKLKIVTPTKMAEAEASPSTVLVSHDGPVRALLRILKAQGVKFLRFMVVDACNNIRVKAVPLNHCNPSTVVTFAMVCFAGTPAYGDVFLPQTGFDARDFLVVKPDYGTLRTLPYNKKSAAVFGFARTADAQSPLCTRGLLSRVIHTAQTSLNLVFVSTKSTEHKLNVG